MVTNTLANANYFVTALRNEFNLNFIAKNFVKGVMYESAYTTLRGEYRRLVIASTTDEYTSIFVYSADGRAIFSRKVATSALSRVTTLSTFINKDMRGMR